MVAKIKDTVLIVKEIKALLVFLGATGITFVEFRDFSLYYMHTYQLHWLAVVVLLVYYMNKKHKKIGDRIEDMEKRQRISELKGKILSAYKQYGNVAITDKLVADYILALEAEREELQVNSFSEAQSKKMVGNIDYDKINCQGVA